MAPADPALLKALRDILRGSLQEDLQAEDLLEEQLGEGRREKRVL